MAGVEVRSVQRGIRMSAQKVRLVLEVVRGKPAREALAILKFLPKRAARPGAGAVRSGVAHRKQLQYGSGRSGDHALRGG